MLETLRKIFDVDSVTYKVFNCLQQDKLLKLVKFSELENKTRLIFIKTDVCTSALYLEVQSLDTTYRKLNSVSKQRCGFRDIAGKMSQVRNKYKNNVVFVLNPTDILNEDAWAEVLNSNNFSLSKTFNFTTEARLNDYLNNIDTGSNPTQLQSTNSQSTQTDLTQPPQTQPLQTKLTQPRPIQFTPQSTTSNRLFTPIKKVTTSSNIDSVQPNFDSTQSSSSSILTYEKPLNISNYTLRSPDTANTNTDINSPSIDLESAHVSYNDINPNADYSIQPTDEYDTTYIELLGKKNKFNNIYNNISLPCFSRELDFYSILTLPQRCFIFLDCEFKTERRVIVEVKECSIILAVFDYNTHKLIPIMSKYLAQRSYKTNLCNLIVKFLSKEVATYCDKNKLQPIYVGNSVNSDLSSIRKGATCDTSVLDWIYVNTDVYTKDLSTILIQNIRASQNIVNNSLESLVLSAGLNTEAVKKITNHMFECEDNMSFHDSRYDVTALYLLMTLYLTKKISGQSYIQYLYQLITY